MNNKISKDEILAMHLGGKLGVKLLRSLETQRDLSIAYSPGVAEVCKLIHENAGEAYRYTSKGNLVAVVSDGTAVLGLGDIGPYASIPVLEGKAVLFKRFGQVDAWPVPMFSSRVNGQTGKTDVKKVIEGTARIADMYGGINLEDIAAPACFEIEDELDSLLDIPVFHDDQWGTAIIALAGILNYCRLSQKPLDKLRIVINGAGAAGIRIADMIGTQDNRSIKLVDSKGVIHSKRNDLNEHKKRYAVDTSDRTLEDALKGADVFIGVSVANVVSPEMVLSMNEFPAIFAMANPVPEIMPELVQEIMKGRQYVMATGRSDYPNQINNVLAFPYIFRAALDVRARTISMGMKKAAAEALARLAGNTDVPKDVQGAYSRKFCFGPEYIIPVPFDPRLLDCVSSAVARAALADKSSSFAKPVSSGNIYHPPDLKKSKAGEQGLFIEAVIRDLAQDGGKYYVEIEDVNSGNIGYIPCAGDIVIKAGAKDCSGDMRFSPEEQPGKFFSALSRLTGDRVVLGVEKKAGGETCLLDISIKKNM